MAARNRKIRHDENTRDKIRAAQIINRLYGHVMGEVELDAAQVSSAKTLLAKVLPDLKALEIDADVTQNLVSAKPLTEQEWLERHADDD